MTDDQADIGAYRGVGGWLLFLCLKLTVLLPLGMLYALAILASTIASLPKDTVIISAVIANIVIGLGIVALSIYAGISLWSIRPGAVRLAKAYLIAHLMYTIALAFECIIAMPLLLSSATGSSSPDVGGQLFFQLSMSLVAIQIAVSGVAHFTIWYLYLCKSKRVRATYSPSGIAARMEPEAGRMTPPTDMAIAPRPKVVAAAYIYNLVNVIIYTAGPIVTLVLLIREVIKEGGADLDYVRVGLSVLYALVFAPFYIVGAIAIKKRKRWAYIYQHIVLALSLFNCLAIIPAIVIFIYWLRPDVRDYFQAGEGQYIKSGGLGIDPPY